MPASPLPSFISKTPDFSQPILYISMIYYISMIICLFVLLKAVFGFIARFTRGIKMSTEVFDKDLEKLDIHNINNFSNTVNSPVPNQGNYDTDDNKVGS